jgi:hypothetical protein
MQRPKTIAIHMHAEAYAPLPVYASSQVVFRMWRYTLEERIPVGYPVKSWTACACSGVTLTNSCGVIGLACASATLFEAALPASMMGDL